MKHKFCSYYLCEEKIEGFRHKYCSDKCARQQNLLKTKGKYGKKTKSKRLDTE